MGGSENFTCNEGHLGPLCESCDINNGFTRAGGFKCAKCSDATENGLKIALIVLF